MTNNYQVGEYKLDNTQMQLLLTDQNTIVIAGAGSGKTLTILGKINYLLEKTNTKPENILVISFTNASVNDITKKIDKPVQVFTFHKLAINVLKINNIEYELINENFLDYIIHETLLTCSKKEQSIILKFLNLTITYKKFINSKYIESFKKYIKTIINLIKTNNWSLNYFLKIRFNKKEKQILTLILKIYNIYLEEKKSTNKLDFDDLITYATSLAKNTSFKYQYIIIDEFQDTSLIRLNLIKEIQKQTNAKIIVVGDDWQSIYRFSGCDLNIFYNFNNFFNNVLQISLTNTYRNSMELIQVASTFVERNPMQIKKHLISNIHNDTPIILVPYTNQLEILTEVLERIIHLSEDIMIISRNNKDIYQYLNKDITYDNEFVYYKNIKIKYFTVHRSKGLEAEYVIILNCNDDYLGFPNKIENNKMVNKLFPNTEIKNAEERRLFYVAITRCKKEVYILYSKQKPSIFVKEIKKIIKKIVHKVQYFI